MAASNRSNGMKGMTDLMNLPKAADSQETAMLARQGTIGQCLQEALHDIVLEDQVQELEQDDTDVDNNDNDHKDEVSQKMSLSQPMATNVMKEFGESVARSIARKHYSPIIEASNHENPSSSEELQQQAQIVVAPAAMMSARVDHYNKINDKWRIIVHDAKFKDRVPLDKNRLKRSRPNLWAVAGNPSNKQKIDLQILAYDDP